MKENIPTTAFVSESTEDLIRRSQQVLGPFPTTNTARHAQVLNREIRSLASSCYRIVIKNVITIADKSIVICTDDTLGSCPGIPDTCPVGVTPEDYVNMVAIVNALVAESGVTVRFEYLLNDVPAYVDVIVNLEAGDNTVYAFADNQQYSTNQTLTLYGVKAPA